MEFAPNEEQQLLSDMLDRFSMDHYPLGDRANHAIPDEGFSQTAWAQLADLGVLALPFPEELGGMDASPADLLVAAEAMGRGVNPEPVLAQILFSANLLRLAGTQAQRDRWLDGVIMGKAHLAVAFAEHETRDQFETPRTAFANGVLNGRKTFVMGGTATDAFIVTARQPDGTAALFLCEASAQGISRSDYRLLDGSPAIEIEFADTPAQEMAGGIAAFGALVDDLRVPIAAEMVGLMDTMLDQTLNYVKMRTQFGTSLGSFQAIQHRLADQYLALEQSRSMAYRAALADPRERRTAGIAAKAFIGKAAVRLGEEAIQLHGGMGVTDELVIGHAHKRALVLANLFGDPATETRRYIEAMRG